MNPNAAGDQPTLGNNPLLAPMGAIFDWDGVVIDSSSHHEESWNRLAREEHRILPVGHFLKGFGMKNEVIISGILSWTQDLAEIARLSLRKEVIYREIIKEWGLEPLRGVHTLLQRLEDEGIPCAIGSSTHRLNITTSLEILGFKRYFKALLTAEDVRFGKPDPEVFLLAAQAIKRNPNRCVVFEDAPMGIDAALAGGMKVVGLTTTHGKAVLAKAHLVVRRLDELDIHRLEGLFA
jgi:HAD superfamily hydrolase (TIGR01509 family)